MRHSRTSPKTEKHEKFSTALKERSQKTRCFRRPRQPSRVKEPSSPKGGDRALKRRRPSTSLSVKQVGLIDNAIDHAIRLGLPLNRMITIDWTLAGIADPEAARQLLFSWIYSWMRSRGQLTAHVWVAENGRRFGFHTHILIHVPRTLRRNFAQKLRTWRKRLGIPWQAGVMHCRNVGLTPDAAFAEGDHRASYLHNLAVVQQYILKAASPEAREAVGVTAFPPQYTRVDTKRCGTSRILGEAAIQKYFREKRKRSLLLE